MHSGQKLLDMYYHDSYDDSMIRLALCSKVIREWIASQ
jgi:hypothetical protein